MGSGPVLLRNTIFVVFQGGGPDPLLFSRSAHVKQIHIVVIPCCGKNIC